MILNPDCIYADKVNIFGQNITNLNALRNLKSIDTLSISNTKIKSLSGLENLNRCNRVSINQNNILSDLKILENLHYSNLVSITNNGSLTTFEGLSGDSLMLIIVADNKKVKDLTGLNSKHCNTLKIFGDNLENYGKHKLYGLNELFIELTSKIDSIGTFQISKLYVGISSLFDITELNQLKFLNDLEMVYNHKLSNCNIDIICQNLDNPSFKLSVIANSTGCNSIEEIKEKCITNTENEQILNQIKIYPHPITNGINIKGLSNLIEYRIVNIEGKIIQNGQTYDFIDVSNLPKGFYVLQIYSIRQMIGIKTFKVIKV
ncbi:MAG: T9SS type A sorting domain-containing protein [Saprospiraceae bacterium]